MVVKSFLVDMAVIATRLTSEVIGKKQLFRSLGFGNGWTAVGAYLSRRWLIFQPNQVAKLMHGLPVATEASLDDWKKSLNSYNLPLMHHMRQLDADTNMPGAVLAKVDRMSMKDALEVRCPLLDREMARFAEGLGEADCWQSLSQTKELLKRIASDYLPAD